jgi:nucleotide-binding universal stress UspA family protein
MKTILVPTDFSETSINAAKYAYGLAKQVGAKKIVLFNAFATPLNTTIDPSVPGVSIVDFETLESASLEGLQSVKQKLLGEFEDLGLEIEVLARHGYLAEDINPICNRVYADVIVMGITGGGILTEKVFGSNTTIIAKHSKIPVIIVPADSCYKHIGKLLLVSDFVEIEEFVPVIPIKKILDDTKAKLLILHVAENTHHSLYEGAYECFAFKELFAGYNPAFHFVVNPNFSQAINDFALENEADITIVIPKKHSLLDGLFKKSHTKELAFHSRIPLMAVHENY